MENTKIGKLSKNEALKSLRDIAVSGGAYVLPQLLELAPMVDFGEYTRIASICLMVIAPFANRWLNGLRIKK